MASYAPVARLIHDTILNGQLTTSGGSSSEIDQAKLDGELSLNVHDRAGGTAAATVTVEHSHTTSTGFTDIPADALVDPETGEAATFDNLSTSLSDQRLIVKLDRCRRFIRVTVAGTSISHDLAISYVAPERRSSDIS